MHKLPGCFRLLGALALVALFCAAPAHAATITIVNIDGVGEGFNDPTPAVPIGGNPGTTIGAQRLYVFQYAANIWGGLLPSPVEIKVQARFDPLSCTATAGVLGSAGTIQVWRNFPNAIYTDTWYHAALANKLAGTDLDAGTSNDINATFNSSIGGATCLPMGWYYGVDGNEGSQIELLPVVLHELGHGLGFSTVTSGSTGNFLSGFPATWDHLLLDLRTGLYWDQESALQRQASAIGCGKLVWDGPKVKAAVPGRLNAGRVQLQVNTPAGIAGRYEVGLPAFGPALGLVTGDVVLVNDGVGTTSDGCEVPFVNAGDLAGKIAIIDRGTCTFVVKVKNAQDAGAVAAIIVNNVAGCPAPAMGGTGSDPTIVIPSVMLTQADGNLLKANVGGGENVTLFVDPGLRAGADSQGRVYHYTPNPFQSGSSVSHFDVSATPNLLMEPAINSDLSSDVDLTYNLFDDIGWIDHAVPALAALVTVDATAERVHIEWLSASADTRMWTVERSQGGSAWLPVGSPQATGEGFLAFEDRDIVPGGQYAYRLGTGNPDGSMVYANEVRVQVPGADLAFALTGSLQNPSHGDLTVDFTLASAAPARLQLVDVAGRVLKSMEVGAQGPGRHLVNLDNSQALSSGVYFLRLQQAGKALTAPVIVVR